MIRVVVIDDHPVYRQGLTLLLDEEGIDVVGEAGTAETGVKLVGSLRPDVIVMDLHLPDLSGVEATRRIVAADPDARVLVLTMDNDDASTLAALRAGARGYLLKEAAADAIGRAVATVAAGELLVDAKLASRLTGLLSSGASSAPGLDGLSRRELEVLQLVAEGRSNTEIGRRLFLAEKTVRNNLTTLLSKTGAATRPELIALARDAGIAGSDGPGMQLAPPPQP